MKLASSLVPHQWRLLTSPQLCLRAFIFSTASTTKSHTFWSPTLRQCRNLQTAVSPIVSSSYLPTSYITQKQIEIPTSPEKQAPPVQEGLGAFQKLPMVMPSIDLYCSALRKSKRVQPTKGIANIAKRERNRGAKQLDALMKELALPLKGYMESFPRKRLLHPYERSLIELTLGEGKYEEVLGKVDVLRKKVLSVGKEHASLCAKALSKKEAEERLNEGVEKLELVFRQEGRAVDDLLSIAKVLRAMPVVDLEMPTLCLVGAPNVGKSSLVRILSTGKPEICNYPFTTRGILMGHIVLNYQRFQVTDTPGLLRRCDEDRNNLEKLTLAVLTHLPTAVLYVHDLTGECGTSPSDQFRIYKEMKERFKDYLWIDAVSKCDLLGGSPVIYAKEDRSSDDAEIIKYRETGPDESIHVSVKTEQGHNETESTVSRYDETYKKLDKLDFVTAAKILFTEPPKNNKFGFDWHVVQFIIVCLPSLAVYLVAQYARRKMKIMDAELEEKKRKEEEKKDKEEDEQKSLEEEAATKSHKELMEMKQRLGKIEETIKEIVLETKKPSRNAPTKTQDDQSTKLPPKADFNQEKNTRAMYRIQLMDPIEMITKQT